MIYDSTIELEEMDIPYHVMDMITFFADDKDEYLKWYSEDQTALGFQFNKGNLKNIFVYILRDSIKITDKSVSFNHKVIRNPHNLPESTFESDEFYDLLSKAMNDVITEFLEWKKQTNDT